MLESVENGKTKTATYLPNSPHSTPAVCCQIRKRREVGELSAGLSRTSKKPVGKRKLGGTEIRQRKEGHWKKMLVALGLTVEEKTSE